MNFEKSNTLEIGDYLGMVELKTAYLFATALQMGAIIGGASESDAGHLFNFGKYLGISFQMKDDWLDSFGVVKKMGKQRGGDIIQNKKTFLFIKAYSIADDSTRRKLRDYFSGEHFNAEEKISDVLNIYTKLGIDEITREAMLENAELALQQLKKVSLPQQKKDLLFDLAESLFYRKE
jgi:geranylgeranyl diphosphate synthase type II